jgi:four helix bundle protein
MKDFRSLDVWHKAHELTLAVYSATKAFPSEERYGLTSQIRRSAVSIPSNIAEGCGRGTDADFARFLQIALGSASELDYQLELAVDLGMLPRDDSQGPRALVIEVKKMLTALVKRLAGGR